MTENESAILITGATGTVGNEVVKHLSSAGQNVRVRAAVRSINKAAKIKAVGAEITEVDYTMPTTLTKAFIGVDKLFLNTPFQQDMVELTSNLVSEAVNSGTVKHIVKLSVLDAEDEPGIMGSRIHRQAEKKLKNQGYYLHSCVQAGSCKTLSTSLIVASSLWGLFTSHQVMENLVLSMLEISQLLL